MAQPNNCNQRKCKERRGSSTSQSLENLAGKSAKQPNDVPPARSQKLQKLGAISRLPKSEGVTNAQEKSFSVTLPGKATEADLKACKEVLSIATVMQYAHGMGKEIALWCNGSLYPGLSGGSAVIFWDHEARKYRVMGTTNTGLFHWHPHQIELCGTRLSVEIANKILKSTYFAHENRPIKIIIFNDSTATLRMVKCGQRKRDDDSAIEAVKNIHRYAKDIGMMTDGNATVEFHWLKRKASYEQKLSNSFANKACEMGVLSFLVGSTRVSAVQIFGLMLSSVGIRGEKVEQETAEKYNAHMGNDDVEYAVLKHAAEVHAVLEHFVVGNDGVVVGNGMIIDDSNALVAAQTTDQAHNYKASSLHVFFCTIVAAAAITLPIQVFDRFVTTASKPPGSEM